MPPLHDLFKARRDSAASNNSTEFPLEDCDVLEIPQSILIKIAKSAPALHSLGGIRISRISLNFVIKSGPDVLPSESEMMKLVSQKTTIHLPKVHRSFNVNEEIHGRFNTCGYIVMDYIEGTTVSECWDHLDMDQKNNIVKQVADAINSLQSISWPYPGPIGGGPCHGFWFSDYGAAPFRSATDIQDFFNKRLEILNRRTCESSRVTSFKLSSFVLSHLDIAPRNLILDLKGDVWIIDWAYAGAYPPFFEAASLKCQNSSSDFSEEILSQILYDKEGFEKLTKISGIVNYFDWEEDEKIELWLQDRMP